MHLMHGLDVVNRFEKRQFSQFFSIALSFHPTFAAFGSARLDGFTTVRAFTEAAVG